MTLLNQETPHGLGAKSVRAVIFDWAGTTIDFGSLAPVRTLERVFAEAGVPITEQEARRDMGIAKRDHIAALLSIPRIQEEWHRVKGEEVSAAGVDSLYQRFIPLQFDCLRQYSHVIPGVPELANVLRSRGIKIGSTTGYTRAMLEVLVEEAANQGYVPDCGFSPEDAGAGRPHPFMIYAAAVKMQVYPLGAFIKVGDTESDIKEGLNAGVWSVGVAATGNGVGLSEEEFQALTAAERDHLVRKARHELAAAGAHYVIDTLAELNTVIEAVEARLKGKTAI
jgi:phosphonoacetaldehyde hydrolase